MLRSRSVSSRSVRRSASTATLPIVFLSLFVASRAMAGSPVVVAGPDGSARVTAIAAELRARGFDVAVAGATASATAAATTTPATVSVAADGSVTVVAGRMRETFPAGDGDANLARRVAEAVRAADAETPDQTEAPVPPLPPVPPVEAAPQPSTPPSPAITATLLSPSHAFAARGAALISVDDAFPLVAIGGAAPLATRRMLRIGDPSYGVRTSPKPVSLDFAVADGLTVGGTVLLQYGLASSILGGALRVGYAIPLGDRLALWPRIGVAYERALDEGDWPLVSRTDLTAEARLVWTVTRSWALTLGPSVAVAVASQRYEAPAVPGAFLPDSVFSYPPNAPARVSVALGITGHLDDVPGSEPVKKPGGTRVFVGVVRAVPVLRYRADTARAGKSRIGTEGPPARADGGTVDATSIMPQAPVLSIDVELANHVTVGAAGSVGIVRFTDVATDLVPTSGVTSVFSWTLSPRLGLRDQASRSLAFWPRVGLTYASAAGDNVHVYHLGLDAEALAVFSPIHGVGLVFGPSVELPIAGGRRVQGPTTDFATVGSAAPDATTTAQDVDHAVVSIGLTGGLVVELP